MFSFLRSKSEQSSSTDMADSQKSESASGHNRGTRIAEQESITVGTQYQDHWSEYELESLLNPTFTKPHATMTPPESQDDVTLSSDQIPTIYNTEAAANGQTRLQEAEPSPVMESIESQRTFGPDLRKYLPSGDIPTYHRLKRTDRSSAPPEDLGSLRSQEQFRRLNYLDRFTLDVLPPPTAPVYLQVLTYIQRFTLWCAKIEDKERWEEMTTYLGEKMEKVWMQAMREGLIPQNWDDDAEIRARIGEEHLAAQEAQLKAQKKRPVDPRAEVVIDTKRNKNTSQNVITIGEIEEAGVNFDRVKRRVESGDLDGGSSLMRRTLQEYGREDQLYSTDWLGGGQRTAYNPRGRDLQAYCLWEVQECLDEMHKLGRLLLTFKMEIQKKNTRVRVADEQRRHDLCLALALELDSKVQYDTQDDGDTLEDADDAQAHSQDEDSEIEYQGQTEHPSDKQSDLQHVRSSMESTIEVRYPDTHENAPGQLLNETPEKRATTDIRRDLAMVTPPETPGTDSLKRSIGEVETEGVSTCLMEHFSSRKTDQHQETPTKRAKQVDGSPRASQAGDIVEADPKEEDFPIVDDVEGYPPKAEILAAMPRDGWKFSDVAKYHKKDDTFAKLLRSVAYSDMENGRWFPRTPQASAMNLDGAVPVRNGHHAYIVSMPYKSPLNPEDYTTQGIHHTKGFRWRYFPGTSIVERAEAKDHVEAYVDSIIDRDKQTAEDPNLVPSSRYGGYEQICDPADPTRKTMIHGIWDTKQSQPVRGNEWFYKGREGEWKPRVFFYQGKTKYEGDHPNDVKAPKVYLRVTSEDSTPTPSRAGRRQDTRVEKKQKTHPYAKLPAPKFKKRTINMNNKPGAKRKAKTGTATALSSRAPKRTMSMHEERKSRAPRAAARARASYTYDEDIGSDGDFDPNA